MPKYANRFPGRLSRGVSPPQRELHLSHPGGKGLLLDRTVKDQGRPSPHEVTPPTAGSRAESGWDAASSALSRPLCCLHAAVAEPREPQTGRPLAPDSTPLAQPSGLWRRAWEAGFERELGLSLPCGPGPGSVSRCRSAHPQIQGRLTLIPLVAREQAVRVRRKSATVVLPPGRHATHTALWQHRGVQRPHLRSRCLPWVPPRPSPLQTSPDSCLVSDQHVASVSIYRHLVQ